MIKVTGKSAVRECTAVYIDPETREETKIRVEYYSHTTKATKEYMAGIEKEDTEYEAKVDEHEQKTKEAIDKGKKPPPSLPRRLTFPTIRSLIWVLHALPDLADPKGKPFAITATNLELLSNENLLAIEKAVSDDIAAKKSQAAG